MNLKAYGTSFRSGAYGSRKRTQVDVTGGCHLCAPHTTPRGDIAYAKSAERLVAHGRVQSLYSAHGRSMVLRRSVACAQVVPSQTVNITEGRGAHPCATDHQLVCVGQGARALPSKQSGSTEWKKVRAGRREGVGWRRRASGTRARGGFNWRLGVIGFARSAPQTWSTCP